jgi:hypothetical protein
MWTADTKAVWTVMPNHKEIPEVSFLEKLKEKRKTDDTKRPTCRKWGDVQDFVFIKHSL